MAMSVRPGRREQAFTLVEVMVAMTVFAIGVVGAMQGITMGARAVADTARQHEALMIAQALQSRLMTMTPTRINCPIATEVTYLNDSSVGNSMSCFGVDTDSNCAPDHPQSGLELNRLLGHTVGDFAADQMLSVDENVGGLLLGGVYYRGSYYRVVWNVDCAAGPPVVHAVQIMVGWGDVDDAVADGRVQMLRFVKGEGL